MKIYFVASIKGRTKYKENYAKIISQLKALDYTVIEYTMAPSYEYVYSLSDEEKVSFYKKILDTINECDILVTEASFPSINVGHEITLALSKGKPVIALYFGENEPHLLQGLVSDRLIVQNYDFDSLKSVLKSTIQDASDQMDVRFNFFVSPRIVNYLDWIAKQKKMPRAVYLRRLIEKDMEKNKEFEKEE
jgi:glutamyl-tRNA reductase